MTRHHRLLTAAEERHWVLSTAELRALGLTRSAIYHRVETGILHRVHAGVYAVGRPVLAPEGRWRAATLTQPDGALSNVSAAALRGVLPATTQLAHVTVPSQGGHDHREGLVIHRCDRLRPSEVTWCRGIRVTTLGRTLRDLAGVLDERGLTRAIRQAERMHRIDLRRLHASMGPPRPGANLENRLRKALEHYVPGDVSAGLEELTLGLLVRHAVPLPETQHPIGRHRADFAWPDVRLVVETDDRASHHTWAQAQEDRARDREMAAAGWEVMRFTWADISRQPARVAAEIKRALIRRRERPAPARRTRL